MVWYSHLFQNFPQFIVILLRNLYAGQEATVRTGHGTTDWFQIGKGVRQGCILSPCLFNFYAEFSSVQFSHSAVSNSLRPHELQHARPPWSSGTPLEFTQTHIHRVGDAIHPSHPLSSPSPPAPDPSQHQSLFQ